MPVNIRVLLRSGSGGRGIMRPRYGRSPVRAASHPDFNRRSRSSTGSASRGCGRVADYNRRFGVSPTPEHARTSLTSVPHELFLGETGHPRAEARIALLDPTPSSAG